jgi:hypothetical protein
MLSFILYFITGAMLTHIGYRQGRRHERAIQTNSLACAIVKNDGPFQIENECVHISRRQLNRLLLLEGRCRSES